MLINSLCWILLTLPLLFANENYTQTTDDLKCDPELPHFSVGDVNLTKENYEDFKTKNKVFVLGLSDSECTECCYIEPMLKHLHSMLATNFTFKGKKIPIARMDIKTVRGSFAEDLPPVTFYPQILMYKYGHYYLYSYYLHYPSIINFFNRVLHPTIQLNTTQQVNNFLNTDKENIERTAFYGYGEQYVEIGKGMMPKKLTRAIAFISSKNDFDNEIKQIKAAAQASAQRDDLRVAFVYDLNTIKEIKAAHRDWFSELTTTSLIMQRKKDDIIKFDISTEGTDYYIWLTE